MRHDVVRSHARDVVVRVRRLSPSTEQELVALLERDRADYTLTVTSDPTTFPERFTR